MRAPHIITQWLTLRALGAAHLLYAFTLTYQIRPLISAEGVSPAASRIKGIGEGLLPSLEQLSAQPTVGLWSTSDVTLYAHGSASVLLALLLIGGFAPRAILALLWLSTLSLQILFGPFAGAPVDALLLEVTLLAVFFAPSGLYPRLNEAPSALGVWLMRLALLKYVLLSGLSAWADPRWRALTALPDFLAQQPAPNAATRWLYLLPEAAQRGIAEALLISLLVAPALIVFYLRGWRLLVFAFGCGVALSLGQTRFSPSHLIGLLTLASFLDLRLRRRRGAAHPSPDRLGGLLALLPLVALISALGGAGLLPVTLLLLMAPLLSDQLLRRVAPTPLQAYFDRKPLDPRPLARGLAALGLFVLLASTLITLTLKHADHLEPLIGARRLKAITAPLRRIEAVAAPLGLLPDHDLIAALSPGEARLLVEVQGENEAWYGLPFHGQPELSLDALSGWSPFYTPRLALRLSRPAKGCPPEIAGLVEALTRRPEALAHALLRAPPDRVIAARALRLRARLSSTPGQVWLLTPVGRVCQRTVD
ncbi:lipase maturation factor family protein [Myxococcota bacterium]|nr:lipase maturation factor family protein [Myxococcota bacterium]